MSQQNPVNIIVTSFYMLPILTHILNVLKRQTNYVISVLTESFRGQPEKPKLTFCFVRTNFNS
jgi:hypothetical protein